LFVFGHFFENFSFQYPLPSDIIREMGMNPLKTPLFYILLILPHWVFSLSPLLLDNGRTPPEDLAEFLLYHNPQLEEDFAHRLAGYYFEEAQLEGINHDIAFLQMILETGFLRFGGQVKAEQNNFCGLGALDGGYSGAFFPSPRIGVRAHIQHLKAYASLENLVQPVVDPRFDYVIRGEAESIYDLAGRWATDPEYGKKIESLAKRLLLFNSKNS